MYGLALIPAMIAVHVLKYPALSAGARYTSATGRTIIEGYRGLGPISLGAAALVFFGTALPIQAVLANVTAAVFFAALGVDAPGPAWAMVLIAQGLAGALVSMGGFRWLDVFMKVLMTVLALTTLTAAAIVLPRVDWGTLTWFPASYRAGLGGAGLDGAALGFLLAFLGWMPAPADVAIWNSLWTKEKQRGFASPPSARLVRLEFALGYVKCAVLAGAFIVIGAALIHAPGLAPADGPALARQLLDNYTQALGPGWRHVVGVCAVSVMFSTLLASTDALPRIAAAMARAYRADSGADSGPGAGAAGGARSGPVRSGPGSLWLIGLIVLSACVVAIAPRLRLGTGLGVGGGNAFTALVDFATITSFVSTPVLAWLHHRLMHGPEIDGAHRPAAWETNLSRLAIAAFTLFAGLYVWTRLAG